MRFLASSSKNKIAEVQKIKSNKDDWSNFLIADEPVEYITKQKRCNKGKARYSRQRRKYNHICKALKSNRPEIERIIKSFQATIKKGL